MRARWSSIPPGPPTDYRAASDQHAREGRWAEAVRDRFRAVVRELEVRTVLDVRPARTATEAAYAASRVLPDCRAELGQGADTFNAVVYGDRAADAAAFDQLVALDEQVVAAADASDLGPGSDLGSGSDLGPGSGLTAGVGPHSGAGASPTPAAR